MASQRHPLRVVKPTRGQRTLSLDEAFPDCRSHPFIRALARRYGFRGREATILLDEIAGHLRLELIDRPFAEPEYDGERVVFTLEDFNGLTDEEIGFEFVHELSHEMQRRSGIDVFSEAQKDWKEQRTEQRALRDSVLYLRYLGRGDADLRAFLRHRYDGILSTGDIRDILDDTRVDSGNG
jgi:hypothetical protein